MKEAKTQNDPCVVSIPAGPSFVDALAQGLLEEAAGDPAFLADSLILLPSRRACRTLREAFLRLSQGAALMLPRMQPLGDVEADEVTLWLAGEDAAAAVMDLPAAILPLERQLLLAQAVLRAGMAQSFDQAVSLARDLGRFLDEAQVHGRAFADLQNLVPEEFAGHWQHTLEFLKIVTEVWPDILRSRGVADVAVRRNLLAEAQIAAWKKNPPAHLVIAAGATGILPYVSDTLACVARLPKGRVVVPGLDRALDDESWDALAEDHPQFALKSLLAHIGIARKDVGVWTVKNRAPQNAPRVRLLSEALRPAQTTEKWRALAPADIPAQALDGFCRIDCDTPQEEADVIALLMRETLQTPGKTAALITPDRRLARRVAVSLRRWGIHIDDSGGQPLTDVPIGTWLMLTAEMAQDALSPVTLLSCLKHPMMAAGMAPEELRAMVYLLDKLVLRGPRPAAGFSGLRDAVLALDDKAEVSRQRLLTWLEEMERQMRAFVEVMTGTDPVPFRALLEKHIRTAETLCATQELHGSARVWQGEAGDMAADFLADLYLSSRDVPDMAPADYVALVKTLLKGVTVRPHYGAHPRLSILGLIEARLYSADKVILGGLNEGTWPDAPAHDPWMSRPMRRAFGLPSPEAVIGISAHDFAQAACAFDVVLTRARKVDGTPTVPARWLLRLETVLQALGLEMPAPTAARYRDWIKQMDKPAIVAPVQRPAPAPPVEARPNKLSVTRIETWMRDPYQIYAQYVLKLRKLDDIDADAGGAERGTFIHKALETFIAKFADALPHDAEAQLLSFGRQALADMHVPQDVEAFWWPRFEKIAAAFTEQERRWRASASPVKTEAKGQWTLPATEAAPAFTLTGTADRIDRLGGGGYAIIDYKSGYTPKTADVKTGLSPQLPLEALMLEQGGFTDVPAGKVESLVYWKVTGGGEKPVERREIAKDAAALETLVTEAHAGLQALVEKFADPKTPYLSRPRAEAKPHFSDYDHLARCKEWGLSGDDGDEGGEE